MVSTDEPEPSAWLGRIAEVLDALGVSWTVAGAVAAARYRSEPRFTTDLDVLTEWHDGLAGALEAAGYQVQAFAAAGQHPHLLIARRETERVDLLIAVVDYQTEALRRGAADRVLTVEDVILHKLIAGRPRDRDDVRMILDAGHELDRPYLDEWIEAWDVGQLWEELCRQVGR